MNKEIKLIIVFFTIITLMLYLLLNGDSIMTKNSNKISFINLYIEYYDIATFDSDKVLKITEQKEILEICTLLENTNNLKRKRLEEHGMHNVSAGYIEIVYKNQTSDKIHFSENKKFIYKVCNGIFGDYYIYGGNVDLYNYLKKLAGSI